MQEKVEEYPLMSKLHLNSVLVWIVYSKKYTDGKYATCPRVA